MAYTADKVGSVTREQRSATAWSYAFPVMQIDVDMSTGNGSITFYPNDAPKRVIRFDDIATNYGTADAKEYVDYLANNNFFFKPVGGDVNGLKVIAKKSDFPTPSAGVIQLENRTIYYVVTEIDLTGERIVGGTRSALVSASPEIGSIKSTGLASGTALITATATLVLNFIGLEHATILNLDATTASADDKAIDWTGVNFVNATTAVGLIKNFDNSIQTLIGFLNSGGLTFDGTIGTVAFRDSVFNNAPGLTSVIVPATATISRRIRIEDSSFISLAGETALNVSASASIPAEGYILQDVNFSGGGTYLVGVLGNDNKARFEGCRGIENSGTFGHLYMKSNATATTFTGVNTPAKILGTTTAGPLIERFSMSANNELKLTGAISRKFIVEVIASVTGGANKDFDVYVAKNGVAIASSKSRSSTGAAARADNVAALEPVVLNPNTDTISGFIANATDATSLTVVDLTVLLHAIPA